MEKKLGISIYVIVLFLLSFTVQAASIVLYFPADYDGTGSADNVTSQGEFAPICEVPGDTSSVRLEGLDMVRGFAGAATCAVTSVNNSLAEEAEFVFLVDDAVELSNYLKTQMRAINALQNIGGREIIKPSVVSFFSGGGSQGIKILVVGEAAFTNASTDEARWFATINGRFAADQIIAGRTASGSGTTMISAITPPPLPSRPLNDYMTECHNNLVPLPPAWNPTVGINEWRPRGVVATPFSQPVDYPSVEVWTYESIPPEPQGVCYALPRMSAGGNIDTDIQLLGVICQSEQTGKACFWDNVERPSGAASSGEADENIRRPGTKIGIRMSGIATRDLDPVNMRDGYNLKENCTDCHRGSNVFLVQKGTPLDGSRAPRLDIDPAIRYQPISGTPSSLDWVNPVSTVQPLVEAATSGTQCTRCHAINGNNNYDNEIPEFTYDYCETIVKKSIGTNMPPIANPANWATRHLAEVRVISEQCCRQGVDLELTDNIGSSLNTTACTRP